MKAHNRTNATLAAIYILNLGWPVIAQANEGHEEVHVLPHDVSGIKMEGGLTWFLQATDGAADDTTALSYTLDLALEAPLTEHGKAVVVFEAGDGEGVDPIIGALSGANYDAFFTELTNNVEGSTNVIALSISQAYYETEFLAGDLIVTTGKLDVHGYYDDNAYANDETDQFMSAIFTRSADTSYAQLDYYYAPGIVGQYTLSDEVGLTLVAANANGSGFSDVFNNLYFAGQVNMMPNPGGYEGNYRLYALSDARDSTDADGNIITSFTKIGNGKKTKNSAWGLSFDQALPGSIGLFARYSAQDDSILENTVESSWSLGGLVSGERWGREHDSAGIAYGSVNLNSDAAVMTEAKITNPDDERHLELFYKYGYLHHFTLTADIQVIENIGGKADAGTVTVYGMRGQLNF